LTEGVEGNVQFEMKRPSAELMKAISAMDDWLCYDKWNWDRDGAAEDVAI
jgi:hypothetical protein